MYSNVIYIYEHLIVCYVCTAMSSYARIEHGMSE